MTGPVPTPPESTALSRTAPIATAPIPTASSPAVLARFRAQRRRDTAHELSVRRLLHASGVRYRVDVRVVVGSRVRPDIVWRGRRVAVFLDGCFWHACPDHEHWPKANASWWRDKIEANVGRDRRADAMLRSLDWTVLRFWEHEDPAKVVATIRSALAVPVR